MALACSRLTRRRRGCACRVGGSRDSCAIGRSEGWPVAGVYSPKTTSPRLSRNFHAPQAHPAPLGQKSELDNPGDALASDAFPEAYAKWNGEYDALPWVDLTAPSAGKHFNVPDLEEFKALMLSLRAEGLRFPDEVLSAIDEEMAEQQSA